MSKRRPYSLAYFLLLLAPSVYVKSTAGENPREAVIREGETSPEHTSAPIWTDADFSPPEDLRMFHTEMNERPTFCPESGGVNPEADGFEFFAWKHPVAGIVALRTYRHNFGEYTNHFSYTHSSRYFGFPSGARTVSYPSGRLLAEAKMVGFLRDEEARVYAIEIQEYHYDKEGKIVFKCKSEIDLDRFWKRGESRIFGEKLRDYYCVWPRRRY